LLRCDTIDLIPRGHGGAGILICWQRPVLAKRLRCKRRGPRARGKRGRSSDKSNGEFQKVAAFHDMFQLRSWPVMREQFECVDMNGR
jgi:hypothetical protein